MGLINNSARIISINLSIIIIIDSAVLRYAEKLKQ
jgi:hypothetical protein